MTSETFVLTFVSVIIFLLFLPIMVEFNWIGLIKKWCKDTIKFINVTKGSRWIANIKKYNENSISHLNYQIVKKEVIIIDSFSKDSIYVRTYESDRQQRISVDKLITQVGVSKKNKKGGRMPRAFRWSLNAAWVVLVWKVVFHAQEIAQFIINRWF